MGNIIINTNIPVVLSMTTVPWRLRHTIKVVRKILTMSGFTRLVVNIPKRYRQGWEIDEHIVSQFPRDPRLIVARTEDYGPATKFIPTLDLYPPGYRAVLIIMDDSEYHLEMIKKIAEAQARDPSHVHTYFTYDYRGLSVPQGVDLIGIPWPLLSGLKRYWESVSHAEECWKVDDLVIAGYLKSINVPIKVLSRGHHKWVWKPIPPDIEGETLSGQNRDNNMDACFSKLN